MRTKTFNSILSPIADTVSQFIFLVAENDVNKTVFPDLSQHSEVVQQQTTNLAKIGQDLACQPNFEENLKEKMNKACDQSILIF